MKKQRWNKYPPTELRADQVLLYKAGTKLGYAEHGFQYLEDFDLVVIRQGHHRASAVQQQRHIDGLPTARLPILEPNWLWMRKSAATDRLLAMWREFGEPWGISLLRSVYVARPLIWFLPDWRTWEEQRERYRGFDIYLCRGRDDWRSGVFLDGCQMWSSDVNLDYGVAQKAARQWIDHAV